MSPEDSKSVVVNETAFVYAISVEGLPYYKIGTTTRLSVRLSTIQVGCPLPVKVAFFEEVPRDAARCLEKNLHRAFDHYRVHGEWFFLPPRIWNFVSRQLPKTIKYALGTLTLPPGANEDDYEGTCDVAAPVALRDMIARVKKELAL